MGTTDQYAKFGLPLGLAASAVAIFHKNKEVGALFAGIAIGITAGYLLVMYFDSHPSLAPAPTKKAGNNSNTP